MLTSNTYIEVDPVNNMEVLQETTPNAPPDLAAVAPSLLFSPKRQTLVAHHETHDDGEPSEEDGDGEEEDHRLGTAALLMDEYDVNVDEDGSEDEDWKEEEEGDELGRHPGDDEDGFMSSSESEDQFDILLHQISADSEHSTLRMSPIRLALT